MTHPDFEHLNGKNAIRYYFLEQHHKCFDPDNAEFSSTPIPENERLAADIILAEYGFVADFDLRERVSTYAPTTFSAWVKYMGAALRSVRNRYDDFMPLYVDFPARVPQDVRDEWFKRVCANVQVPGQPCVRCGRDDAILALSPCRHAVCSRCFDVTQYRRCPVCQNRIDGAQARQSSASKQALPTRLFYGAPPSDSTYSSPTLCSHVVPRDDMYLAARSEFRRLCLATQPLPAPQANFIRRCCETYGDDVYSWLPATIVLRKTTALIFGALMKSAGGSADLWVSYARRHLPTATDVLQMIAILSGRSPRLDKTRHTMTAPDAVVQKGVFGPPEKLWRDRRQPLPPRSQDDARLVRFHYMSAAFKPARMSRAERRRILALLESFPERELFDEMRRYRAVWVRLGEKLHPSEYARRFPKTENAFAALRKKTIRGDVLPKRRTWRSRVESALREQRIDDAVRLLRENPDDFARNMVRLLAILWSREDDATKAAPAPLATSPSHDAKRPPNAYDDPAADILQMSLNIAKAGVGFLQKATQSLLNRVQAAPPGLPVPKTGATPYDDAHYTALQTGFIETTRQTIVRVSTPLLLTLYSQIALRESPIERRFFKTRSKHGLTFCKRSALPPLDVRAAHPIRAVVLHELLRRFAQKRKFATCTIDSSLNSIAMPRLFPKTNGASASLPLGSRVPLHTTSDATLRLFLYWRQKSPDERVYLEFSVVFFDQNFDEIGVCSQSQPNVRHASHAFATHSNRKNDPSPPNGACEFVDIDKSTAVDAGVRYAVANVLCYNEPPSIGDLDAAYVGISPQSGAASDEFDPQTTIHRFALTELHRGVVPLVFDLVDERIVVANIPVSQRASGNVKTLAASKELKETVANLIPYSHRPSAISCCKIACMHAAARCNQALIRRDDAKTDLYYRGRDESDADFYQRMTTCPPDATRKTPQPAKSTSDTPELAFLLRADVGFPPGSEISAIFDKRPSDSVDWTSLVL